MTVTNADVTARTGLQGLADTIARRRQSLFGHIARLDGIPAYDILKLQVDLASGRPPGRDWKRRHGRPRNRWIDSSYARTPAESRRIYGGVLCNGFMEERRYGPRCQSLATKPTSNNKKLIRR